MVTVTGTENLMMAAALAEGTTVLENAAREPEVVDLAELPERDGREDSRAPAPTSSPSRASSALHGATHASCPTASRPAPSSSPPRRPAARVQLTRHRAPDCSMRCSTSCARPAPSIDGGRRLDHASRCDGQPARGEPAHRAVSGVSRPTCRRSSWRSTAVAARHRVITETIFENRFMHVQELQRLGADIEIDGNTAIVRGVPRTGGRDA